LDESIGVVDTAQPAVFFGGVIFSVITEKLTAVSSIIGSVTGVEFFNKS
jgi:hypothetical protein